MLLPPMAATPALDLPFYAHFPLLIVVVSLVYSATRHEDWKSILGGALRWGIQMTGFLLGIGIVLYAVSWFI